MDNTITKEDIIERYKEEHNKVPLWSNKKIKEMSKSEILEYNNYRNIIKRERRIKNKDLKGSSPKKQSDLPDDFYDTSKRMSSEEIYKLVGYTTKKTVNDIFTPEERQQIEKKQSEDKLIQDYFEYHKIDNQEKLNYVIEHDEKFKLYLEKIGRLEDLYKGSHLKKINEELNKVNEELKQEAKKDKKKKIFKKFEKKKQSNTFEDATKELDLTPYKNKKLEKQGQMLCIYLRKNGLADMRYVKMDEVGQIKVDGYVYHERDANYRFGKKNDPVLLIIEGSLVPIHRDLLKEYLGTDSAEAQKLIIKGIEQAEIVKASGVDEQKKGFTPPKWAIILAIAIAVGVYAYFGGFK